MIPKEVVDLAELIEPDFTEMDEMQREQILRIAWRIRNAGYSKTIER